MNTFTVVALFALIAVSHAGYLAAPAAIAAAPAFAYPAAAYAAPAYAAPLAATYSHTSEFPLWIDSVNSSDSIIQ